MNGTQDVAEQSVDTSSIGKTIRKAPRKRSIAHPAINNIDHQRPRYLFHAWREISDRITSAKLCALLLDFDGTLVKIQLRPMEVRVPKKTKNILDRLSRIAKLYVAIVSGRRRKDLQTRIGVETLHYIGLHGAEVNGRNMKIGKGTKKTLALAKRQAQKQIAPLRGMRIEDKGLSFAVHYREATAPVARAAKAALLKLVAPLNGSLKVFEGAMVWEVLPNEIGGKGTAAWELLNSLPKGTPAIYIGDDGTDESAFHALSDQITIRVGNVRDSRAKYYLRNPGDVIRFLLRLETELL
jgi:trehalose 6-phosphate phosphatase